MPEEFEIAKYSKQELAAMQKRAAQMIAKRGNCNRTPNRGQLPVSVQNKYARAPLLQIRSMPESWCAAPAPDRKDHPVMVVALYRNGVLKVLTGSSQPWYQKQSVTIRGGTHNTGLTFDTHFHHRWFKEPVLKNMFMALPYLGRITHQIDTSNPPQFYAVLIDSFLSRRQR